MVRNIGLTSQNHSDSLIGDVEIRRTATRTKTTMKRNRKKRRVQKKNRKKKRLGAPTSLSSAVLKGRS